MVDDIDGSTRERLLHFRDSIVEPLANTDADKWPIRSGRIGRLCLDEFSSEFFTDIQTLYERGMSTQEIAALFEKPTRLWRMSHHLLNGLRLLSATKKEQQKAILTLLDLIKPLKYGDIFCRDGTNTIWPPQIVAAITSLLPVESQDIARLIHRLAGTLWAYAESLYFVAHELSVEIHGPYTLSNGYYLFVRDFSHFHPDELWLSTDALLPQRSVRIMIVYKQFHGHLDVYNNLYLDPGMRLTEEAVSYAVLIDDHAASTQEIQQLIQSASNVIQAVSTLVDSWSLEQTAHQYVHIFWWRKAVLSKALEKDWSPPQKVLRRVVAENILDPVFFNPSIEALSRQYDLL